MIYGFRRAVAADLPLLTEWLRAPHLTRWFDNWVPELERPDVRCWIVTLDEMPLGYIQDYRIGSFEDHHLAALGPDARGIDQFIGPETWLGQGHGPGFIRQHAQWLLAGDAPAIGTDPDPDNSRAIRAYEKVGFRRMSGPVDSKWGRFLPMAFRA